MHPQGRYSLTIILGLSGQPGSPIANRRPVGFVNGPLPLYRSAALVKVLLERLRRAIRALRVLRSTLTMLATQRERLLGIHEAQNQAFGV